MGPPRQRMPGKAGGQSPGPVLHSGGGGPVTTVYSTVPLGTQVTSQECHCSSSNSILQTQVSWETGGAHHLKAFTDAAVALRTSLKKNNNKTPL